jgi:prepilin-type processing-associated H-X9-DG protein
VIAIIAVLIALLLPAVQAAREAARRSQCVNNLMQIGVALHNYEGAFEVLPPGVVDAGKGPILDKPEGYGFGWLARLTPYMEMKNVYNHFNMNVSLYDEVNLTTRSRLLSSFICPSENSMKLRNDKGIPASSYVGMHHDVEAPIAADNRGVLFLYSAIRYEDVPDGSSNTIYAAEKLGDGLDLGWASGTRASLRNAGTLPNAIDSTPIRTESGPVARAAYIGDAAAPENAAKYVGGIGSNHAGGANMLLGDGAVRFLKSTVSADTFRLLVNRADGEVIDANSY